MGLFKRKPKVTIEEFCQQFYDTQIFNAIIAGADTWKMFCETAFDLVVQADQSFAAIDRAKFQEELTAIRMEVFALAWMHRFKREDITLPQSISARSYLEAKGKLLIWDIIGEYNQVVAQSVSTTETGKQVGGYQAERANEQRFAMFYRWAHAVGDRITPEQKEEAGQCVARVANRIGADIGRGDCILVRLLSARLAERLACKVSLSSETLFRLSAIIYGLYQGAKEVINEANLAK